jgi:hypothetical protein
MKEIIYNNYIKTVSSMDSNIIKPYSETEIQPLYDNYFIEKISELLDKPININLLKNQHIIKSMLIMTLFDLYNIPTVQKDKIINWYLDGISQIKKTPDIKYKNLCLFYNKNNNNLLKSNINIFYNYAYTKWGDIFADNCYETLGIFNFDNTFYLITKFYIDGDIFEFVGFSNDRINIEKGNIDFFGHSNFKTDFKYILLKNNKIIHSISTINKIINNIKSKIHYNSLTKIDKFKMICNRFDRYNKLFKLSNITIDIDILKYLSKSKINKKINQVECNKIIKKILGV